MLKLNTDALTPHGLFEKEMEKKNLTWYYDTTKAMRDRGVEEEPW